MIEKIQAAGKTLEAVYALAQEAGVTDSFEEFKAEMTKMYESMSQELSEEELLSVAGGSDDFSTGGVIAGSCAGGAVLFILTVPLI